MIQDKSDPQLGRQFIKRMVNDIALPGDVRTMNSVVAKLFPKDSNGQSSLDMAARGQAAENLIKSLNGLDKGNRPISQDAQNRIIQAFTDSSLQSVEAIAERFEAMAEQKSAERPGEEKNIWQLFADNNNEFKVSFTEHELQQLRYLLNQVAPGLGDLVGDLFRSGGVEKQTPEVEVRNDLAQGFDVMTVGGQGSLGRFLGVSQQTNANGEPIGFNLWNPEVYQDPDGWFGDGVRNEHGLIQTYKFYPGGKEYTENFDTMVVEQWVADGTVTFASAQARQDFIDTSQILFQGKMLDESFIRTVNYNSESADFFKFESPEAKAAFLDFTSKLDSRLLNEHAISDLIIEYVEKEGSGVGFPEGMNREEVDSELVAAAQYFVPVADGQEYAERIMEWFENDPNITIKSENTVDINTPSAANGMPSIMAANQPANASENPSPSQPQSGDKPELAEKVAPNEVNDLAYGQAVLVTQANAHDFAFRDRFFAQSMQPSGDMDIQEGASGNIEIGGLNELRDVLGGGDFMIQAIKQGGVNAAYFAYSPETPDQGVYLEGGFGEGVIDINAARRDVVNKLFNSAPEQPAPLQANEASAQQLGPNDPNQPPALGQ